MNASTIHHPTAGRRSRVWPLVILAAGVLGFAISAGLTLSATRAASPSAGGGLGLIPPLACGDGKCELGEDLLCPDDCNNNSGGGSSTDPTDPPPEETDPPSNDPVCGNGICEDRENATNCAVDCLVSVSIEPPSNTCGNNVCDNGEDSVSCAIDCQPSIVTVPPILCGDGICDLSESAESCPVDCSPSGGVCGNGVCEDSERSNGTCLVDCPISIVPVCGNAICETGETFLLCPKDCPDEGAVCGDGVCEDSEADTCDADCRSSKATVTPTAEREEEEDSTATDDPDRESGSEAGDEDTDEDVTETVEASQEATERAIAPTDTPAAANLEEDEDGPSCLLVDYDSLDPAVQTAFSDFDASYDPQSGQWLVCERMPSEACLPADGIDGQSAEDLRIINCTARGTCSAHAIRSLEDGEACGRAGRLRQLTCLDGCTLVRGSYPISVTGTVIPLSVVLLVIGGGTGVTYLSLSRRGRELEEEFDDIFHLDPSLVTTDQGIVADEPGPTAFYQTLPLDAADFDDTIPLDRADSDWG